MLAPPYFGRCLIAGGILLALLGLALDWALPIPAAFPPFLVTAFLAVALGAYEIRASRPEKRQKGP